MGKGLRHIAKIHGGIVVRDSKGNEVTYSKDGKVLESKKAKSNS